MPAAKKTTATKKAATKVAAEPEEPQVEEVEEEEATEVTATAEVPGMGTLGDRVATGAHLDADGRPNATVRTDYPI